jgi:hypothetical protein
MTMFTTTITRERHIEELRAELRAAIDAEEALNIRAELDAMLLIAGDVSRQTETPD